MIPPNCKSVDIARVNGQLVVVVNFENGFTVWTPELAQVNVEDGVRLGDITLNSIGGDDDDDDDDGVD